MTPKVMCLRSRCPVNSFLGTRKFRTMIVRYLQSSSLMSMRSMSKDWRAAVEGFVDSGIGSGVMKVHERKDISDGLFRQRAKR